MRDPASEPKGISWQKQKRIGRSTCGFCACLKSAADYDVAPTHGEANHSTKIQRQTKTMKTYVVCIDGTWNNPNQTDKDPVEEKEKATETNVLRVYRFLTGIKDAVGALEYGTILPLQVSPAGNDAVGEAVYLNGVGSAGTKLKQLFDGATGTGTSERILDAYRFLAARQVAGDR